MESWNNGMLGESDPMNQTHYSSFRNFQYSNSEHNERFESC